MRCNCLALTLNEYDVRRFLDGSAAHFTHELNVTRTTNIIITLGTGLNLKLSTFALISAVRARLKSLFRPICTIVFETAAMFAICKQWWGHIGHMSLPDYYLSHSSFGTIIFIHIWIARGRERRVPLQNCSKKVVENLIWTSEFGVNKNNQW